MQAWFHLVDGLYECGARNHWCVGILQVEGNIVRIHKQPGWLFGDVALLFHSQRSASVVATNDITLWALSRRAFSKVSPISPFIVDLGPGSPPFMRETAFGVLSLSSRIAFVFASTNDQVSCIPHQSSTSHVSRGRKVLVSPVGHAEANCRRVLLGCNLCANCGSPRNGLLLAVCVPPRPWRLYSPLCAQDPAAERPVRQRAPGSGGSNERGDVRGENQQASCKSTGVQNWACSFESRATLKNVVPPSCQSGL